eukprot:CAMPEP_0170511172 /NCGR_PEP_ID=MMETSP0208-20121228/66153_1 /TAXON_ID=197538 /ORGANISM="Strombidium inclinatum, Strain S3" /LENGTH=91 /DNA_ID=CAMNT_0010794687 /DNA_START=4374 /DNA_END=4649 /DNA_ORIENTATION=+
MKQWKDSKTFYYKVAEQEPEISDEEMTTEQPELLEHKQQPSVKTEGTQKERKSSGITIESSPPKSRKVQEEQKSKKPTPILPRVDVSSAGK